VYVGINILDWSFIQRAHKVSLQGMGVMYGVMFLTVFVDLIVAVGLGVFISNIIIIDNLSKAQARKVKGISDSDDNTVPLTPSERSLLDSANGRLLFFYLSGPMIFSVSKAISRQHSHIADHDVMILDLTDVPMFDVTVGLALENAIKDAHDVDCDVFLLCPNKETHDLLENFNILELIPKEKEFATRGLALQAAIKQINGS
jgi:SulP family sulfate permease